MTDAAKLRALMASSPFHDFLGLELLDLDPSGPSVALGAKWRPGFEREPGSKQWHGGVLAAVIDIAGAYAAFAKTGRGLPTVDLRIEYMRPAIDTDLRAEAKALRAGRTLGTVDVALRDKNGVLVAAGRGTYFTQTVSA